MLRKILLLFRYEKNKRKMALKIMQVIIKEGCKI